MSLRCLAFLIARTAAALLVTMLSAIAVPGCAGLTGRKPDDLHVTRAVLYQNGIGYFERQGTVDDQSIKLRILPNQIADVLKSLTVVDLGTGRAVNIALPVEKTRTRRLAALPEQVRTSGGLVAISQAFRGARARVAAKHGSGTGRIVGVENLDKESGDYRLTILGDDGTLMSFPVAEVEELQIQDRTLEVGLRKALDVALDEGSWKPVELVVHLAGQMPHKLMVSYVVEMPTWKPAYRVVLTKDRPEGLLQGWAVVDNISGEDWDQVALSLTAGTPLTFAYDLYSPRFVRRPDLSPQQEELAEAPPPATDGAAPAMEAASGEEQAKAAESERDEDRAADKKDLGGAYEKKKAAPRRGRAASGPYGGGAGAAAPMASATPPPPPAQMTSQLLERSFSALVAGSRIDSLFRYDIEAPVTIKDRQSALVSILNKRVPAEDVLLYRMDMGKTSPYRAVRLTNTTGYMIEKGPVAIYKDGNFVGEAVGGKVEANTSTFIPYSMDGRFLVSLEDRNDDGAARLLKIYNGQIVCEVKQQSIHKYVIYNRSGETATLFVQRAHRTGWKLVQPKQGVLVEKEHYFAPIAVKAKGSTEFEIKEETPTRRWVEITSSLAKEAIGLYINDAAAIPEIKQALTEALDLQNKIGTLDRELERLRRAKGAYSDRQNQVRDNLKLLGKSVHNADLARRLTDSLKKLETELDQVTRELVAKDMKRSELADRLTVVIKSITLQEK